MPLYNVPKPPKKKQRPLNYDRADDYESMLSLAGYQPYVANK